MKRADRPRAGASAPENNGDAPTPAAPSGRHRPATSTERIDRAIRDDGARGDTRRAPARAPSWGRVLVSTGRVWLGRRVPSRTARRAVTIGVAAVVVVAVAGAVLATRSADPKAANTGADPDAAARTAAAAWISHDVTAGTRMACERAMCARLRSTGVDGGDLVEIGGDATKLSGARLVVATRAVRERFGTALAYTIAPDVLGIFGVGPSRVEVRERSPYGLAAHDRAKAREQKSRQHAGLQLLNIPHVHTTSDAMHELAAGEVDNRLVYTLAKLARHHTLDIASFSGRGPYTGIDVPERVVDIDQVDGSSAIGDNPAIGNALHTVRVQSGTFRAASAQLVGSGSGGGVLRITFTAPTPPNVLRGGLPRGLRPQPKPKPKPHPKRTREPRRTTASTVPATPTPTTRSHR
ncbi:MAG TPA: hypothetical protein VGL93_21385 [Streptosporangiaceae bacterium]